MTVFMKRHFEMRVLDNKPKHTKVDTVFIPYQDTDVDNHLRFEFTGKLQLLGDFHN